MALRKVFEMQTPNNSHKAIVVRDSEWDEYRVRFYENAKWLGSGTDYHTQEKQDAIDTAQTHIRFAAQAAGLSEMTLENTWGKLVAHRICAPNEVIATWDELQKLAETIAIPIIFFNGKGFSNRREFLEYLEVENQFSRNAGGTDIWS
jgi:hypothetical protein